MSETNDISRLFSRFGGHPDQYQEIGRDNLARSSEGRWPLLASVARQTATMQSVRDMGHASSAMESPAGAASAAAASAIDHFRSSSESFEARPLAQPGVFADMLEPRPVSGGAGPSAALSEGKAPLAQFIAPRRRTSPPQVSVAPEPVQPPAQVLRHRQVQALPETRMTDHDWRADRAPSVAPTFANRSETVRPSPQARPQSPLQALFSRLERAGASDAVSAHTGVEPSGTRASVFERLARR